MKLSLRLQDKSVSFLGFVGVGRHADSSIEAGLFELASEIEKDPTTSAPDKQAILRELDWFNIHLPVPDRFNRTRSKGFIVVRQKVFAGLKILPRIAS